MCSRVMQMHGNAIQIKGELKRAPEDRFITVEVVFMAYPGRAFAIFGHLCIVMGYYLFAWGIYLLPASSPTPAGILTKPLFWGLFSIFSGICAVVHSRCRCVITKFTSKEKDLERISSRDTHSDG